MSPKRAIRIRLGSGRKLRRGATNWPAAVGRAEVVCPSAFVVAHTPGSDADGLAFSGELMRELVFVPACESVSVPACEFVGRIFVVVLRRSAAGLLRAPGTSSRISPRGPET